MIVNHPTFWSRVTMRGLIVSSCMSTLLILGTACGGGGGGGTPSPKPSATAPILYSGVAVCPSDSPSFRLTVQGGNFNSSSVLLINGRVYTTTFLSPTQLATYVNGQDFAGGGTCQVQNSSPALERSEVKGAASASLTNAFLHPTVYPLQVAAGSPSFSLSFSGVPVDSRTAIIWNGLALSTTLDVPGGRATATIPSSEVANPGYAVAALYSPDAGAITPAQVISITTNLQVSQLMEAPSGGKLVALSPDTSTTYPGALVQIDPLTGQVSPLLTPSVVPTSLAVASDKGSLYLGSTWSSQVMRLAWPGLTQMAAFDLGATSTASLLAVPGRPGSVMVGQNTIFRPAQELVIFDDGVPRNLHGGVYGYGNCMTFDADAGKFYALDNAQSGFDLTSYSVDGAGFSQLGSKLALPAGFGAGIGYSNGRLYVSNGLVLDLSTMTALTSRFGAGSDSRFLLDPPNNRVYFIGQGSYGVIYLTAFNLTTFAQVGALALRGMTGMPQQIVRWGRYGLAIIPDASYGTSPTAFVFQSDLVAPFP